MTREEGGINSQSQQGRKLGRKLRFLTHTARTVIAAFQSRHEDYVHTLTYFGVTRQRHRDRGGH